MLPTSHYDEAKANRAVTFIQNLCHTKGKWAGTPFDLLPWQDQIVRDLFGIVRENGKRQFLTAYVEIPKKQGKSELAAAIALYLLYADNEPSAEVYGAACDRNQASIVFDVAKQMVLMSHLIDVQNLVFRFLCWKVPPFPVSRTRCALSLTRQANWTMMIQRISRQSFSCGSSAMGANRNCQ